MSEKDVAVEDWASVEAERLYPCSDIAPYCKDGEHSLSCAAQKRVPVAAALRAAEQRGREQAAHEIEEPYPEDVFPPLGDTDLRRIVELLDENQHGRVDRLHAGWARHWARVIRDRGKE